MSSTHATPVTLDRAQRQAVRGDIRSIASGCGDLYLKLDETHNDRAFVVRKIAQLQQLVVALDAIGWAEPDDAPNLQTITVDADLALWAAGAAVELEHAMPEFVLDDEDLDALSGLKLIAGA